MPIGLVFKNNGTQAVRLPVEARFPENIKKVNVRVVGSDRILSPVEKTWDSFFQDPKGVTEDFMNERASQEKSERDEFQE